MCLSGNSLNNKAACVLQQAWQRLVQTLGKMTGMLAGSFLFCLSGTGSQKAGDPNHTGGIPMRELALTVVASFLATPAFAEYPKKRSAISLRGESDVLAIGR